MIETWNILTEFIAIGVRNESGALTPYRGLNCEVEYSASSHVPEVQLRKVLREVLAKLDHKTVGVDLRIEGKPTATLSEITAWLFKELQARVPQSKELVMRFGNGVSASAALGIQNSPAIHS